LLEGAPKSCLITSIAEPKYEHFGAWRKLYREGEYVVVQNQLLLSMVLGSDFNSENPYEFIPDRYSFSEDGVPASEWLSYSQASGLCNCGVFLYIADST
jgi:CdiI N-terminal domain